METERLRLEEDEAIWVGVGELDMERKVIAWDQCGIKRR